MEGGLVAGHRRVKTSGRPDGPEALDLLEEAAHLVRCAPLSAAALYATGVVPFLLASTYFVADMSRGAYALARLPGEALALTLAFAWMKAWQAVAAEHALAFLEQREPARCGVFGWLQLARRQFSLHALGLLLLPVSASLILPAGWVYAYFQNATVLGLSEGSRAHRVAGEQARLWPAQNHAALGSLSVLALLVVANVGIAIYFVPSLVRTLTGTERMFAQTGWNPFNTTFLAAVLALGFLVLDPVVKAFYVLRCFYGRSRRTGVDLLVQVRRALGRPVAAIALAVALAGVTTPPIHAQGPPVEPAVAPAPPPGVEPARLERSLDRVLSRPEYVWRDPAPQAQGMFGDFARWVRGVNQAINRWLRGLFDKEEGEARGGWGGLFGVSGSMLMWLLALVAVGVIIAVILSVVRRAEARRRSAPAVAVATVALEREDVTADQLAEAEWMRLGRDLIARGEIRLGMRALFLGSLAALASRGDVHLARHKSNRDYERELARRGAPLQSVAGMYGENRRAFERVWYGSEVPDDEALSRFEHNVRLLARKEPA